MSKRRLVITAVLADDFQSEVARTDHVSQGWISRLMARYREEGQAAFEPLSRRPHRSPNATAAATVELVLRLRKELTEQGHDAGADTIGWHLRHHHATEVPPRSPRATIHRILVRHPAVVPDPSKRPKSSSVRFPHPGHRPDRARRIHHDGRSAQLSRIGAHRQRHGLHDPTLRRPRRPQPPRVRAARAQHHPEELPTQPPHHVRQGREIPADDQEVATPPTRPTADHQQLQPCWTGSPSSTTPPSRTRPCLAARRRPPPTPRAPRRRRQPIDPATPTTGSAPTRSATTAR